MTRINYHDILSGKSEAKAFPKDFSPESQMPDYAFNILNQRGLLYQPVVDEYRIENGRKQPKWPADSKFAVCLTHDVDVLSKFSLVQACRRRYIRYTTSTSLDDRAVAVISLGPALYQALKHLGRPDPLFCLERWLEIEEQAETHSTFFFWPGYDVVSKRHHSDLAYQLFDRIIFDGQPCTVAEAIREIARRGWEIGLHASWYAFDDVDELRRQKDALEKAAGQDIISIRQHYLHYDIRVTPRVHAKAGFLYDSTLGFNDNVGFRFGTCYPWYLWDLEEDKELTIMEIPLIVQDTALLNPEKGMRLDEGTAFQYIQQLAAKVEDVGGVLTLSWHPEYVTRPSWWRLYLKAIDYLKTRQAWFGNVREIMTAFHQMDGHR